MDQVRCVNDNFRAWFVGHGITSLLTVFEEFKQSHQSDTGGGTYQSCEHGFVEHLIRTEAFGLLLELLEIVRNGLLRDLELLSDLRLTPAKGLEVSTGLPPAQGSVP